MTDRTSSQPSNNPLFRLFKVLGLVVLVLGALLTFPNGLPWLLLFVVTYQCFSSKQLRRWCGLCCVLLIGAKFPEPGWGLFVFLFALGISFWQPARLGSLSRWAPVLGWVIYFSWFWVGMHSSENPPRHSKGPVVCVGDSLTDFGYPQELEKMMDMNVVDLGFNGYTTDDGLNLLPQILAHSPTVVVLELGGHDYKDGQPRSRTKTNLETLIETIQGAGAAVVLVEIPRGFLTDPYFGLERQLARKYDLELVPDTMIRRLIFWSPVIPPGAWVDRSLLNSDDGLHPNERGNRMMARYIASSIERVVK